MVSSPEPRALNVADRSKIEKAIVGAITSAIDAHGPITRNNVSSAGKRVYGALVAVARGDS